MILCLLLVAAPAFSMVVQNGHTSEITALAVSADRKLVLSAGGDGLVKLWTIDGKLLDNFEQDGEVTALALAGDRFVTGDGDGKLRVWSLAAKKVIAAKQWHKKAVRGIDLHGDRLASVSDDGRLVVGTLALEQQKSFNDEKAFYVNMSDVRFLADGKRVITTAHNIYSRKTLSVIVWDLATGAARVNEDPAVSSDVNAVALGPSGEWFATVHGFEVHVGAKDESVKLWRTSDMKFLGGCKVQNGYPRSVGVSPDGRFVYGGNVQGEISMCSVQRASHGALVAPDRVVDAHRDHINVILVFDERMITAASSFFGEASGIALWRLQDDVPRLERRFPGANGSAKEITWRPDGGGFSVAYGYPQSVAVAYSLTGRAEDSYRGHRYEMHAFAYDPTGPRVLTGSHDMTARLWTTSGVLLEELKHPGVVYDAIFAPNGDILTACGDGNIRIFAAADLQHPRVLAGHKGNVYSLALAGARLYSSGEDKTVRAWEDGKIVATFGPLKESISKIAVRGDVVYASVWGGDTLVLRAEATGFREAGKREGNRVVVSADGARVVTKAARRNAVFIYDAAGKRVREIPVSAVGMAISPNGRWLAIGNYDGVVSLYSLTNGAFSPVRYLGDGDEWLVYKDDGDFDSSPRGAERVAMVKGTAAYRVEQFALQSNRPERLLAGIDEVPQELLAQYAKAVQRRFERAGLKSAVLELVVPEATLDLGARKGREQTLRIGCKGSALKSETIFVNGVPVSQKDAAGASHSAERTITLAAGDNAIEASCRDARGVESFRAARNVSIDGTPAKIFVATLGVSRYADPSLELGFAHKDATDVAEAIAMRFSGAKRLVRTDAQVNAGALETLKAFFAQADVGDTAVLFFAGHGLHDDRGNFYALPHGADTLRLAETALPFAALEGVLADAKARNRLLLLDACESGDRDDLKIDVGRGLTKKLVARGVKIAGEAASAPSAPSSAPVVLVERDRYVYADLERRSGAVVIASSRGDEWSFEDPALGHGLFSHGLLAALEDKQTDANKDGKLSVHELERAIIRNVRSASGGRQHPMVLRDNPLSAVSF